MDPRGLLIDLGAPARLVQHGTLVEEAAEMLLGVLRRLDVQVDETKIHAGALLHDVGKISHPGELHGGGNAHEADGEALLLAHGVDPTVARMCRSHAQWRSMDCDLEDLLVALADVTWRGVVRRSLRRESSKNSPDARGRIGGLSCSLSMKHASALRMMGRSGSRGARSKASVRN
jgi:putative nucleotidyltransferase with HDIG domain